MSKKKHHTGRISMHGMAGHGAHKGRIRPTPR